MSSKINLKLRVSVVGGPEISLSDEIPVEAYDKIDVTIVTGDSDKEVVIQPVLSEMVQLLLIRASEYGKSLTYKVHKKTDATPIALDKEQLFLGKGAVGLLGTELDKFFFTNNLGKDVTIEILIGRDAIPEPQP